MASSSLIPGFRFHPTDIELVMYYLKRKILGKKFIVNAVAEVNIYDFSPWDLPDKSSLKSRDLEWFFFVPKLKKYSNGSRFNRATESGFWKATGKDRQVKYHERIVATIKTLVFHLWKAGVGERTNWVMHEYKMEDEQLANAGVIQDMYVLCKVFEKSGSGPKVGAQYGAPFYEEEWNDDIASYSGSQAVVDPAGATNTMDYKQNGMAAVNMTVPQCTHGRFITEPGSSAVTYSENEAINTLICKEKGPATVDMNVSVTEPGSSSVTFSENWRRQSVAGDDLMLLEEIASILGVSLKDFNDNNVNEMVDAANTEEGKNIAPSEDSFYDDLVKLIDLDELNEGSNNFKTDGTEGTTNKISTTDDLDAGLRWFYVD
uniref:NAC domain-containing protein 78-like n=1 Tax=Erigeron canadensis TaxID=72917 RepID=UPI001CB8A8F2|nr:NAC domain-containing protein 78-like [Erigeron canadensis]